MQYQPLLAHVSCLAEYIEHVTVGFSDTDNHTNMRGRYDCLVALDCDIGWLINMDNTSWYITFSPLSKINIALGSHYLPVDENYVECMLA